MAVVTTRTARHPGQREPSAPLDPANGRNRYWEIDLARTVAIGMMVVYHGGYDVDFLAPSVGIDALGGGWRALQVATGSLFLFLVGVSFTISDAAARRRGLDWRGRVRKHARRGLQVIGCGLAISLVTWIALDDRYVRFGILHAIGASLLLAPFVARLGLWNAALGVAVILVGLTIKDERSDVPGLLLLGWEPTGGAGVDYYPLLPWFGPVLLGIAVGTALYPGGRPGRWSGRLAGAPPRWLTAPGRRSLIIYLVHQPVLIVTIAGVLAVLGVDWAWPE
jgi:uncharacterized membrane protein